MDETKSVASVSRVAELVCMARETLCRITVGDPLKTLFRPVIELHAYGNNAALCVQLHSVNADTGDAFMVPSTHPLAHHQLSVCARNPKKLSLFVHQALVAAMKHEVDESVRYDGERVVAPEHWGPASEPVAP